MKNKIKKVAPANVFEKSIQKFQNRTVLVHKVKPFVLNSPIDQNDRVRARNNGFYYGTK